MFVASTEVVVARSFENHTVTIYRTLHVLPMCLVHAVYVVYTAMQVITKMKLTCVQLCRSRLWQYTNRHPQKAHWLAAVL
jgi:hypothetical protein